MSQYGLKELFNPEKAEADIVFVHGVGGNRELTWKAEDETVWPKDFLPKDIPNARILTFGYDAEVTKFSGEAVSQNGMKKNARDLGARLMALRAETKTEDRPIVFVAHSLGGLVCAQALVLGDQGPEVDNFRMIAKHLRGMAFFGTPFQGPAAEKWASSVTKIVSAFYDCNEVNLEDLQRESQTLKDLGNAFPTVLRKRDQSGDTIGIVFFREQLKTKGVMVVDADSATIPGQGDPISIHANHINICKFEEREDDGYQRVVGELKKLVQRGNEAQEGFREAYTFHNYGNVFNQAAKQNIYGGMNFRMS